MLDQVRPLNLIDEGHDFPDSLKALDGRRVSMVGFMAPFDSLSDMRRCMIVPSYVGCNFCSPPNLTQVVYVTQGSDEDSSTSYPFIEAPSHVTGILRLSLPDSDHDGVQQGFVYSIENAVVTAHSGDVPRPASGHGTAPHQPRRTQLEPIEMSELIQQVSDIVGQEPLLPIELEPVSEELFGEIVRASFETTFPETTRHARTRAFQVLGLLPEDAEWIDSIAYFHLFRSVAKADETGERIYVLDSVPIDHPYVRLGLVGEISDAMSFQYIHHNRTDSAADDTNVGRAQNDDARRAREAIRQGIQAAIVYRYATIHGISLASRPPASFVQVRRASESYEFRMWDSLPRYIGSFFVQSFAGDTGPLTEVVPTLTRPPSTTMEFFRPQWYEDATLWQQDPVASGFADNMLDTPPTFTDVLGIGGLVPMLSRWHSFDAAKTIAGGWVGDRWAIWQLPDGGTALILEIRWRDEESAIRFRESIPDLSLWSIPPHQSGSTRVHIISADSTDTINRLTSAVQADH
ncbi:MAG: DUF3299 domain-containing protein [Phycisphaerales bacterium JB043]